MLSPFSREKKIGLTIAGGGTRSIFALGVLHVLTDNGWKFSSITSTSAGTGIALGFLHRKIDFIECLREYTAHSNFKSYFSVRHLVHGKHPFLHEQIYADFINSYLDMDIVKKAKARFLFYALKMPENCNGSTSNHILQRAGLVAKLVNGYRHDNKLFYQDTYRERDLVLPGLVKKLGIQDVLFKITHKSTHQEVINACLAASSAPPIINFKDPVTNEHYLDGGFKNNLPTIHHPKDIDFIVAIYYRHKSLVAIQKAKLDCPEKTFYISPDRALPVSVWDYTNHEALRYVYKLGQEKAFNLLRLVDKVRRK